MKKEKADRKMRNKEAVSKKLRIEEALQNVEMITKGNLRETKIPKNGDKHTGKTANSKKRHLKNSLKQDGILVKHVEGEKWYAYQVNEVLKEGDAQLPADEVAKILEDGREALKQDTEMLQQRDKMEGGSEASWFYSVITKGTAADRRSAMTLQMHKSPVHSLEYVEKLLSFLKKSAARDTIDTIPILEDVFLNNILPNDRKLVSFSNRPLADLTRLSSGNERMKKKIMLLWAFENEVKIMYQRFLQSLAEVVARPLEDLSKRALRSLSSCLIECPEAENVSLTFLVNAFGHPNYKIGAYLVHLFETVIRRHPAMRLVIVNEIERLIFRKNVNERAHLYSVTFLSQVKFSSADGDLSCKILSIYFGLFKTLIQQRTNDHRLLPILLAGANRAFPFASGVDSLVEDLQGIYSLTHSSNNRTSILALRLLFQFHKLNDFLSDRYYCALYRKLLDPCTPSAYSQFLKLLFETLKSDTSAVRVRTFVKRLLQVAASESAEFSAAILLLISKLRDIRKGEQIIVLSKEATSTAVAESKLIADDEEERYFDVDVDGTVVKRELEPKKEEEEEIVQTPASRDSGTNAKNGWVHRANYGVREAKSPYNPDARNPLFTDCSQLVDSELLLLSKHFHPSVSVFAKCLLEGGVINYGGEPLTNFALMSFLDRFAFRNPKIEKKDPTGEIRVVRKKIQDAWGVRKLAIDSKEYMAKKRDEIPADERFLHRYAATVLQKARGKPKKEVEEGDEWEYSSVNSEEFDAIIDRFEPGELNEEFDIDYSKEFSAEKKNKSNEKKKKKKDDADVDGDDDDDDLEEDLSNEEDDEEGSIEDDEEEDDSVSNSESDDDQGKVFGKSKKGDQPSDDDIGESDYEMAGDEFAAMLEEAEDEEANGKKRKKKLRRAGKFNKKAKR